MRKRLSLFISLMFVLTVWLIPASAVFGQNTVKGTIIDDDGEPVVGATVLVKSDPSEFTITDIKGNFTLTTKKSYPVKLTVTYVGFKNLDLTVRDAKPITVLLELDTHYLDEVVVSAQGIIRSPRQQGYSANNLSASELNAGKSPTVQGGLVAKIPGLQVNAISSGVNPSYRLVLRGNRSITGENQALVVLDGAVVTSAILGNINPQDIENISVLNGASGATLYGSEASNGVILVTTKKGRKGRAQIKFTQSLITEQVNFYPKMQTLFGQGSTADAQEFSPEENQQYGPKFDGTMRELGLPLENGDQQYTAYSPVYDRNEFWATGLQSQSDLSISFGGENSTSYISGQYLDATGTTPGDKYNRISVRLNSNQKVLPNLNLIYAASYVENHYDTSTATDAIYENLVNIPANVPILNYKDWQNDKWSTPDGWFNPWYENPYYTAANNRQDTKNTYLTGKIELKWDIKPWLTALYRASLSNRYYQSKQWTDKLTYSDYSVNVQGKTNIAGSIYSGSTNYYRLNQDFQLSAKHEIGDISLNLILGASHVNKSQKASNVGASGLVIPGLFNIGNRVGDVNNLSTSTSHSRNYGIWADFLAGYKNYLFLHLTGRNDWTSVLLPENRQYFYPSADVSFVPTDAFDSLKGTFIDFLKVRAALSKTGNVNLDPYSTEATYGSTTGYSKGTYFTESGTLIAKDLKPEITTGWEVGAEFRLLKNLVDAEITYYQTSTTGEAIESSIATSTGYTAILLNSGEVTNKGYETALHISPIHTNDWHFTFGGNLTHNENMLKDLLVDRIGVNGSGVVYAQVGQPINIIVVTDYARVPEKDDDGNPYPKELVGKVIVDKYTGYPSRASESQIMGNTIPKYRLGADFSLRYKDFVLSSLFEYRGGYQYASISLGSMMDFTGSSARTAYYNRERFVFPNSVINVGTASNPQYQVNNNVTISDPGTGFWTNSTYNRGTYSNYVYSGDYWKWREVSLSYNVPAAFIRQISSNAIQAATISFQGRNLFLWASKANEYTDPDYSANDNNAIGVSTLTSSPPSRYLGGSISLTF